MRPIDSGARCIAILLKFIKSASPKTREEASKALRQIASEESSRGVIIQEGGLKLCSAVATDDSYSKAVRLETAHVLAQTLVTTNPNLLNEHQRKGVVKPLIYLCSESDANNLMQFEALLSLTNILSCGVAEQEKFVSEKGISIVHYLMFSDHLMVRRAATETLCNMAVHDNVVKMLKEKEKLPLWLGLCEEIDVERDGVAGNQHEESIKTAMASSGTLATAAAIPEVADMMVQCNVASTLNLLFLSGNIGLGHRALVIVKYILSHEKKAYAEHLAFGNIIQSMNEFVTNKGTEMFRELVGEVAVSFAVLMEDKVITKDETIVPTASVKDSTAKIGENDKLVGYI